MARNRNRYRKTLAKAPRPANVDATPERLGKGDYSEMVNPAEIDSSEQPIGLTRRFKATHLDRLHRAERLTWAQWYAGDWYRTTHARCGFGASVTAGYGERTTGGEVSYGLARTERQAQARDLFRAARTQWPADMTGFMDRFLIHDELPRYGGREAARRIRQIGDALEVMAEWLTTSRDRRDDKHRWIGEMGIGNEPLALCGNFK